MQLEEVKIKLDELLKPNLAYDWDNVGLTVGEKSQQIQKVLLTLEINDSVINEAIENKVDLIISHHPLIFKPIKSITNMDKKGSMLFKLIKNSISVYIAHTNFDILNGGLNDYISNLLLLKNIEKLAFENSDLEAMGRYGELETAMDIEDFISYVKIKLGLKHIRLVDGVKSQIKKIGIVAGSGMEYVNYAYELACDAYLTGDVKYHDAQDWLNKKMHILDIGHYGSEIHFKSNMLEILNKELSGKIDFIISDALKDPFRTV